MGGKMARKKKQQGPQTDLERMAAYAHLVLEAEAGGPPPDSEAGRTRKLEQQTAALYDQLAEILKAKNQEMLDEALEKAAKRRKRLAALAEPKPE
jgi:hypothetical protein